MHAVPLTFAHLPTEPAMLHERPVPVHAVSQQMPDAQLPLVHALLPVQVSPLIFFATHAPPAQKNDPLAQSPSTVHDVLQVVVPQA